MKRYLAAAFLILAALTARAQDKTPIVFDLPDAFVDIDTLPQQKKFKPMHMIGVKYSYDLCTVQATPDIGQGYIGSAKNFYVAYTYYHDLWDYLNIFGLQIGAKFGEQGYSSEYNDWGERTKYIEIPFLTQLHLDAGKMRFLIDLGPYYCYKLGTDKPDGFDRFDIRHDYGIIGGGGLALVFKPFEIQVEGQYKYSLCSMYHTNKYSDLYWVLAYPRNIMISAGIFFHL